MKRKLKSALSLLLCMIMVFGAVAVGGEGFADVLNAFSVKSSAVTTYSSGDYEYTLNQFNKATLTKFTGKKTSTISIPTTIDEYEVSALGESLYKGYSALTSVDIPSNIKSIYPDAFNGCTSLSSVKLNDGLEVIGYGAFTGTAITEITIPKTVWLMSFSSYANADETSAYNRGSNYTNASAFYGANKLKKVVFADGVTKIGECSLYNCKYLTEVIIPDTVKSICDFAFAGCTGLKNIVLTDAVDRINEGVFEKCTGLTSIEIPGHIKAIYPYAFNGCTSLSSVKLNDGLEVIGYGAFTGTAITEITIPKTVWLMSFSSYANADETSAYNRGSNYTNASAFYGANKLKKVVFADGVTKIGECSLYNCKYLTEVIIPDTVKSIGDYAFANCTGLTELSIPNSVSSIGSKAFNGIDPFVINVSLNSAAAIYAIDNGIMFNAIDDEFTDSNDLFLNRSGSSYISETTGKVSTSGTANLQVNYSFKKSKANYASNIKIKIKIPADTELVANTLRDINNNPIEVNEKDGVITVPVTQKSGTIKFSVLPTGITDLLSYATIEYTYNNVKKSEIIGILSEEIAILTLDAQDVVTSNSVTVKGIAPPETDVTLYVDNKIVKSVKTNKAGNYMTDISLGNAIDGRDYIITAKCQDYGSTVDFTVTYKEKAPELKTIDLYYNGSETPVTIYPESNITPYVSFAPGKPFTFKAEIDNPEEVDKVYVTSTRNGVVKSIEANYDKSTNQFVATGYFDEENHSYVPGKIGVEYKLKHEDVKISADVDFKSMYNNMPNEAKDAEVKVISSTANSQVAEIDVSKLIGTAQKTLVKVAINEYEGATGTKYLSDTYGLLSEVDGWIKTVAEGKDGKEYQFFRKDSTVGERAEGLVYIVKDVTDSKIIEMMIGASETPQNAMKISDISAMLTKAGTYADFAKLYFKTMEIKKERAELDDKIRSTVPVNKQAEALRKSALLENDKTDFLLLTTLLPLTLTAMGVATGPAGIIFTGLLGAMTATSSFFWNFRTSNILGGTGNIKFAVDPSGFVYEGSEENRIENVIATAYWIESDGSDTFFQNKPSSSTYGTKWNAAEYSQANPLRTDIDGKYAWDVPEGWWRVKYEKDGYETVWSNWMPVPPPQTDVNICMTKLNDPNKEYTVTWSVDGEKATAKYKAGENIVKPADPTKEGYIFKGWTPSVPATMPAYDIIFTAVFEKSTVQTGTRLSIKTPSTTTVNYGFTLNLHANVTDLPEGARVVWSMDGSGFELIPSADGMTCGVKSVSKGSATITAKVVDKNGNAVKDANGNEITASQQLTSKAGFFQKLAAFFKKLFGSNMVIPYALEWIIK